MRRRFYIRKNGGNNAPWFIGLFVLLAFGGGLFIYVFQSTGNAPQEPETVALDGSAVTTPSPIGTFKLPKIIEHPESDGEVPPMNSPLSDEHDADYEAPVAPAPPPPPPKVGPKKLPKPKLIKKTIYNTIPPNPDVPVADRNRTVDILIVYTKEAKERLGGPEGVLARANQDVAYTNFRFHEKKVKGTLRLVGLVETEYPAPTQGDTVKTGLDALRSGQVTCGKESVHKLRNKVGADLVCIWINANRGGGGGLAQIHGTWSSMNYPVTSIFRHEMAHNYGWKHSDRDDYSMIQKNYPGMAKWNKTKVFKDRLYVQYWTDYEETDKK